MNTKPVTLSTLAAMKAAGRAHRLPDLLRRQLRRLLEDAGVEVLLVGDSLGMVLQGQETTVPVTLDQMVYHCACVARGPPPGAHPDATCPS